VLLWCRTPAPAGSIRVTRFAKAVSSASASSRATCWPTHWCSPIPNPTWPDGSRDRSNSSGRSQCRGSRLAAPRNIRIFRPAAACVDHLLGRDDVDADRIGLVGWSLGGYYAPRAAAFEKRLALCVAWGANHDWGAVQKRRLEREGENPVPHYWDHVLWVWGETDLDTFIKKAEAVNLDGVVEHITVPFLIAHGENDRQIPLAYAHRSYEQAVNSPKRELRVFSPAEGATEHIGLDHLPHVSTFIADWVADTFRAVA
jgi:fermentation-respiration switch protein FrsA (DUF1100 family)